MRFFRKALTRPAFRSRGGYRRSIHRYIVICTLTALVILCSGTSIEYGAAAGAELTISGFTSVYGSWISIFTAIAMCCFAFSTILGWGLYGARCIEFLFSEKVTTPENVTGIFLRKYLPDLSILLEKRKNRRNQRTLLPGTESRLPEAVTVRQRQNILMPFLMISWNFMVTEVSEMTMPSSAASLHWMDSLLQ